MGRKRQEEEKYKKIREENSRKANKKETPKSHKYGARIPNDHSNPHASIMLNLFQKILPPSCNSWPHHPGERSQANSACVTFRPYSSRDRARSATYRQRLANVCHYRFIIFIDSFPPWCAHLPNDATIVPASVWRFVWPQVSRSLASGVRDLGKPANEPPRHKSSSLAVRMSIWLRHRKQSRRESCPR